MYLFKKQTQFKAAPGEVQRQGPLQARTSRFDGFGLITQSE